MATVVKDCPLCGSHTLDVPQHPHQSHYRPAEDAFIMKCREKGVKIKVIARLMGIGSHHSIQHRIKTLLSATRHV